MKKVLKLFADLKVAIFLLILICICCIVGSIIEQEKTAEYYSEMYPDTSPLFGFLDYKFIEFFSLNHLFRAPWFISLLLIFGFSLLICTFFQQIPSVEFSKSLNFYMFKNLNENINLSKTIPNNFLPLFLQRIKKENYFVFQKCNNFYAYKGIIGRLGPIVVHLSIILILIGSIIASTRGFTAQEIVPKTEIFYIQNSYERTTFDFLPNLPIRVNDFWVDYSIKNNFISQFYSNLSILKSTGQEILNKTISVNNPIEYDNIMWYQTDWDLIALRVKINNDIYEFPLNSLANSQRKIWLSWIPLSPDFTEGILFIVDNLKGNLIKYDNFGQFNGIQELGQVLNDFTDLKISILDIISSTGLQIKFDPGILFIYIGFGFLIISTLLSYISYSKVWIVKEKINYRVVCDTNRSKLQFEIKFLKILQQPSKIVL